MTTMTTYSERLGLREHVPAPYTAEAWGHKAPVGCIAIRVHGSPASRPRFEVADLPNPGNNAEGWRCWSWFWTTASREEAEEAISRYEDTIGD